MLLADADWVRQSFIVNRDKLADRELQNRNFSTASLKFVDTKPGGNRMINPPPQFTRSCDIPSVNFATGKETLGRYYSEAIDDNSQVIYMRFGVPQFNSLTTFFTTFYDSSAGQLARTGRAGGVFYQIGKAMATVVLAVTWEIQAIKLAGLIYRFATGSPSSKFYYLKPTMLMYWDAVTTIVNRMAVNRGIIPALYGGGDQTAAVMNAYLAKELPGVFLPNGGIDVYNIAGRSQRLARKVRSAIEAQHSGSSGANIQALSSAIQGSLKSGAIDESSKATKSGDGFIDSIEKWFSSTLGSSTGAKLDANTTLSDYNAATAAAGGQPSTASSGDTVEKVGEDRAGFMEQYLSSLDDGLEFVALRVNYTGQMSESFSNSVGESGLASKINNASSSSRTTRFDFADGNVAGDNPFGKALQGIIGGVKDLAAGAMDAVGAQGIAALAGSAFVDIPKHWEQSMASLPRANYTISLVSPYGNPISQLLNIDFPLALLLAAALPMGTGRQSYTSPFILELYDQGRCQTRLGIIDSLSITRGVGNLGFNNENHAMAIDVSFSVMDLSSIVSIPIGEGLTTAGLHAGLNAGAIAGAAVGAINAGKYGLVPGILGATVGTVVGAGVGGAAGEVVDFVSNTIKSINNAFSDDTAFNDYMAVLAGMSLQDQIYATHKLKFNLTNIAQQWNSYYSASHFAAFAGNELPSRLVSAVFKGTSRGNGPIGEFVHAMDTSSQTASQ